MVEGRDRESGESGNEEQDEELDTYAVLPPNGGWGWLVVVAAFYCNAVVDGIQLTFGVFLGAISKSFGTDVSRVALAGSLMFGIHLLMGPVCAGLSKEFGLRPVTIAGSLICCFGVGVSYFATGYWFLYISFGVIGGIGLGLVYMNSLLITSVYFTTLMPIALAIVVCGTGVGTMVFAGLGRFFLQQTTWQNLFLIQSALAGSMAIAAATFKPLKPVKVEIMSAVSRMRVPAEKPAHEDGPSGRRRTVFVRTSLAGRRGSAVSPNKFQSIIWGFAEEAVVSNKRKEPCKSNCWRCKKKRKKSENILLLSEIRQEGQGQSRKSYVERGQLLDGTPGRSITQVGPQRSRKKFTRLDFDEMTKTKGFAILKRTLKAMLDFHLMASLSFVIFTISGAIQMAGFLIVFIFEKERCVEMGFSEDMSVYFLIFLGATNMFWRLLLGGLASLPKVNYWMLAISTVLLGGIATIFSGFETSVYYQFGFCFIFGMGIASFAVFRIVQLVDLVGKEKIENATGINMLFMGIFCVISPPFFGWLMELTHSYDIVFITTGTFIVLSGMMLIGLK